MKTLRNVVALVIMLFTIVAAVLLLLSIFQVTKSAQTQRDILQLAEACGVIALASLVLFGLADLTKR